MTRLANLVQESTPTAGTGAVTLVAYPGYSRFSQRFVDGDVVYYVIEDGANWEIGLGTVTASTNTLARTTVLETLVGTTLTVTGATAIALSGNAIVRCSVLAGRIDANTVNGLQPATAATASTLAQRDGSGNLTAVTFNGALNGNASTATSATSATSATTATNSTQLGGMAPSTGTGANTIAQRDASGNLNAASQYNLGGTAAFWQTVNYRIITDVNAFNVFLGGGTNDPTSYYNNTTHKFRDRNNNNTVTIDAVNGYVTAQYVSTIDDNATGNGYSGVTYLVGKFGDNFHRSASRTQVNYFTHQINTDTNSQDANGYYTPGVYMGFSWVNVPSIPSAGWCLLEVFRNSSLDQVFQRLTVCCYDTTYPNAIWTRGSSNTGVTWTAWRNIG